MKRWVLLLGLISAVGLIGGGLSANGGASATVQDYALQRSVIGGGGETGSQISSTVGQTAAGWSTGSHQLGAGYWYGIEGIGIYSVFVPVLLRNY